MTAPKLEHLTTTTLLGSVVKVRSKLCDVTVADYAAVIKSDGGQLPPPIVYRETVGGSAWVADGWHRCLAHKSLGKKVVQCEVRQGTRRDAVLFAVGANTAHGLRRTNDDKRACVELILEDEEWRNNSDAWLAEQCGVSDHFVAKVRAERYPSTSNGSKLGKDGKTRKPRAPSKPRASSATRTKTVAEVPEVASRPPARAAAPAVDKTQPVPTATSGGTTEAEEDVSEETALANSLKQALLDYGKRWKGDEKALERSIRQVLKHIEKVGVGDVLEVLQETGGSTEDFLPSVLEQSEEDEDAFDAPAVAKPKPAKTLCGACGAVSGICEGDADGSGCMNRPDRSGPTVPAESVTP